MSAPKKTHAPLGSFPRALGEICFNKRRALKLTQIALAKKAGVNKDCPSTAEYGGVRLKLDTLMRLSKGLETEPDILIREALDLQEKHIRSLKRAAVLRAAANTPVTDTDRRLVLIAEAERIGKGWENG